MAKEKHLPVKVKKANKYKHKLTPWITSGIIKSIKYKDKLYKTMKSHIPDSEAFNNSRINLQTYNRILQKTIREAKTNYYGRKFDKYKHDSKKTWSIIKQIINKKKKTMNSLAIS